MNVYVLLTRRVLCCLLSAIILPGIIIAQGNTQKSDMEDESIELEIKLSFPATKVSIKDQVAFDVKLINTGKERLTIFERLGLGYLDRLLLVINGEPISEEIYYCTLWPPPRDSASFISLFPGHYYGATLWEKSEDLFVKPGKYSVFAVYWNRQTESDMEERFGVKNLWGEKHSPIKSSPVWIEVTGD